MGREENIEDFFQGLKVTFTYATMYFKEHPVFLQAVEDLKKRIDSVIDVNPVLKIGITPHALLTEDKHWEKARLYEELATFFHYRKIKAITITKGVALDELVRFLNKMGLPPKEILKGGGPQAILEDQRIFHISIEELDYSQLLKSAGEQCKDIWAYLLKSVVDKESAEDIKAFTDNFEVICKELSIRDLRENAELRENMAIFLAYLRDHQNDKFRKCAKRLIKTILCNRDVSRETSIESLRIFFEGLAADDFADLLLAEIATNENFDSLSFGLFTQIADKDMHREIATSLAYKIRGDAVKDNQRVRKKLEELFFISPSPFISEVYQHTLLSVLQGISQGGKIIFDPDRVLKNYHCILLNLLIEEERPESLTLIGQNLLKVWEEAVQVKEQEFLNSFFVAMEIKKKKSLSLEDILAKIEEQIIHDIEKRTLENAMPSELSFLLDRVKKSAFDNHFYLRKIFKEKKVSPPILRLFLTLFPESLKSFYRQLKRRSFNLRLLRNIVECLKRVDSPVACEVLKYLFAFPGKLIKLETVKAMAYLSEYDRNFLFSILKKGDVFLRRESLRILAKEKENRADALRLLLTLSNPLGLRAKPLRENIELIVELNLIDAKPYLVDLSQTKSFWYRSVRRKAQEALGVWNEPEA
ncbi:MAG: hypothetical protein JSW40_07395 [Candidatus Omnitrophota bacterium]|nr:MAG: hypothetical protein JSW40_07395 [Candidatus Omnitrophota bacterium]